MEIRGAWYSTITAALRDVNEAYGSTLRLRSYAALGKAHESGEHVKHRLTLRMDTSRDPFHRRAQHCRHRDGWRCDRHNGYRMPYVCWHGHREFMRALLIRESDAVIIAGSIHKGGIRYNGRAHFETTHEETGERNIGSRARPYYWYEACDCDEYMLTESCLPAFHGALPSAPLADPDDPAAWTPDSEPSWHPGREDYGEGAVCAAFATALAATQRERKG